MWKKRSFIFLIFNILILSFSFSQENVSSVDSFRSRELNRKGIELFRNGLYNQALDTFFYCLDLRKELYGEADYNLAPVYSGIGITYRTLGQFDLALKYYKLAEQNYILKENQDSDPRKNLFVNIGNVYRDKLDFKQALQYFEQALALYETDKKANIRSITGVNYSISEIYYILNKFDKAREIINSNLPQASNEDKILFYELLAFINQIEGKIPDARKNYLNVIRLTEIVYGENYGNITPAYLNYAYFLISNNEFGEAEEILAQTKEIIGRAKLSNGNIVSDYFKLRGFLFSNKWVETQNIESFKRQKIQNFYVANEWYKKALTALNFPENYNPESTTNSESWISPMKCISLLKLIADNYMEISSLELPADSMVVSTSLNQAIETFQKVTSLIQKARKELSTDESKIELTSLEYSTFYKLIQASYTAYSKTKDLNEIELAFQNSERIKSSSVYEKISGQLALENSLVPDSLINLERTLNNLIVEYTEKLFEEKNNLNPDTFKIAGLKTKIFNTSRQREQLNQYLKNNYEDFYELKFSNSLLSIHKIQNLLNTDQVILEYVLNETDSLSELYTFFISAKKIDFKKQVVSHTFINSIETMFGFMSNRNFQLLKNKDSQQFCTSSFQLYKTLIYPFREEIRNKKLTIIPDGKLSYIPFEGLIQSIPDTSELIKFNRLDYLIQDFDITYANSANLLFSKRTHSTKFRNKTLAFAPQYSGDSIEIGGKFLKLMPLPGVKKEVDFISKIVNTKVFEGDAATEENFRNNVANYDILHLAMHAFINDSLPALSSLAFSQLPGNEGNSDGLFKTPDIYNLNLKAKLTVLSACNTGIGTLKKGEGLMSLARGFLFSGCPSTLVSLWEIDDNSGTQIISSFYKHLKKGKSKGEALRAAKLEYLKSANSRNAHPHYWLSFVAIGNNSPLYVSYDLYFFIIIILVALGIGIDQFFHIKKARKKRA